MAKKVLTESEKAERKRKIAEATYEVGYGKTSPDTRFKPGQSGNPRGPRPGVTKRRLIESIEAAFEEPVDSQRRGTLERITAYEAVGLKLVQLTLGAKSLGDFVRFMDPLEKLGMLQASANDEVMSVQDQLSILEDLAERLGASPEKLAELKATLEKAGSTGSPTEANDNDADCEADDA